MNIPLIMALMAGQHRHRYTDLSGNCSICGKEHSPHNWRNGTCSVCGFSGCTHDGTLVDISATSHRCSVCGKAESHNFQMAHNDFICQECLECGRTLPHSFSDTTSAACGQCNVCGDEFSSHSWYNGKCSRCGYVCEHPSVNSDHICSICGKNVSHSFSQQNADGCGRCDFCGEVFSAHSWDNGKCSRCGYECKHPSVNDDQVCDICGFKVVTGTYYVPSGTYAGSYIYAGDINDDQRYYRQHRYNTEAGVWEAQSYYLVMLNVGEPTQYGGNYAYTASGAVFVTSVDSIPINDTLLSGNGRYNIHLKQYTLDGDFIAEGSYTSEDCQDLILSFTPNEQ